MASEKQIIASLGDCIQKTTGPGTILCDANCPLFGLASGGCLSDSTVVEIQDKRLTLSNLEKVLYPAAKFTKGQVIDYYARIAPVLVPHLAGRPLTLKRYPNGVDSEFFFEKNATKHRPDWVKTAPIWSEGNNRNVNYILANDLATLVWVANLAGIELHPSLSKAKNIESPTMMVFDLDPGAPANIVQCCQVGFWLREIFDRFGLQSFPKTSGSKGLQIYVPLNSPTSYDETKPFAHALARLLEDEHRELVVSDMKKALRTGKVLVDWSQNDEHKTTIAVYSLRARERPTVSTPVSWDEVEQALKKKDANLLRFEAEQVLKRVDKLGDLFAPVRELKQKLPKLAGIQESKAESIKAGLDLAAQAQKPLRKKSKDKPKPRRTAVKKSRKL
ncbi:MAG TPA: non-homologous end-joining DNA ligase [Terriglobales bacterium]